MKTILRTLFTLLALPSASAFANSGLDGIWKIDSEHCIFEVNGNKATLTTQWGCSEVAHLEVKYVTPTQVELTQVGRHEILQFPPGCTGAGSSPFVGAQEGSN